MVQLATPGAQTVASASYYPPAWESHPMLPPGHLHADPKENMALGTALSMTPPPRVEAQPTPQAPMSVASGSSEAPSEGTGDEQHSAVPVANERGRPSWSHWMCCVKRKVEPVARIAHGVV